MLDDGVNLVGRKPKRRTATERAAIVSESYEPGATVAEVARRHGIVASQLSSWRTAAKRKTVRDLSPTSAFAEISLFSNTGPKRFDGIEIVCGDVVIRLPKSTTSKRVSDIAQRLVQAT